MLAIRFLRVGKKKQPSFHIVVTQKEKGPKAGRFVEKVGFYNPLTKENKINAERIKYWLSVGAKPSVSLWNLLVSGKIIEGKKIAAHKKPPESAAQPSVAQAEPQQNSVETKEGESATEKTTT